MKRYIEPQKKRKYHLSPWNLRTTIHLQVSSGGETRNKTDSDGWLTKNIIFAECLKGRVQDWTNSRFYHLDKPTDVTLSKGFSDDSVQRVTLTLVTKSLAWGAEIDPQVFKPSPSIVNETRWERDFCHLAGEADSPELSPIIWFLYFALTAQHSKH